MKNGLHADRLLKAHYDTSRGIYDHVAAAAKPNSDAVALGSVALHPAEDMSSFPFHAQSYDEYISSQVKDYYGLSYDEFVARPTYKCKQMIEVAKKHIAVKERRAKEELERLQNPKV